MRLSKLLSAAELSGAHQAPSFITFYDAERRVIGKIQRQRPARMIRQAQDDRAQMDQFRAENPCVVSAIIDGWENLPFSFDENGYSYQGAM